LGKPEESDDLSTSSLSLEEPGRALGAASGGGHFFTAESTMNRFHPLAWTIRTHLLVIVLVLTAFMVGWTVSVNTTVERLTLARATDAVHERSAKISERYLAISRETQHVLTALSSSEAVRAGDFQAITALLEKSHAAMPHYSTMVAVSPDGFIRACSIPVTLPLDVRQRQWFKRIMESKTFVVDEFIISKSAGTASLPYALPILNQEGEVRLILGAALKLSFFEELFAEKMATPGGEVYLLDHEDVVLFAATKPQMIGLAGKDCLPPHLSLRGPGLQEIDAAGGDNAGSVYVVVPIIIGQRESRFTLVVGLNERELYADAKRQMTVNLLLLCGCATAFAVLLFAYGRRVISDPLRRLLSTTKEVSSGNFSARTGLSYQSPEFGVLARAIDGMIAALETDVSHRQEQEKALRESEARFKALVNNAADAIYLADERGRLLDVNAEAERQTGYSREELLRMRIADVDAQAHDDDAMFASFLEHLASVGKTTLDTAHRSKNGTIYPVEVRIVYLPSATTPMVLGVARDITERRRAEEEQTRLEAQLQQGHKLQAVGQLAGGVAHDFNNMLGVIIGYSEMILEKVDPSQQFHTELAEIQKAAKRSAELTRQLLTFARKQTVAPKVLDLNQTIEGMLTMLRRLIGENISLIWMPGSGLWPIYMDPSQIDQILANLCVNGRDAIAGVGKMTVETKNVSFDKEYCSAHDGSLPGDYVRITVSDTGCGMDKETLAHIFEPFFTTKDVGEGTGLGLATVYGAVKQNNGFINAYSEAGQGSTFTIYIPRHVETSTETRGSASAEPVEHGDEIVMLVEDEPTLLQMSKTMLERLGYTVLAAGTPSEAIRLAGEYSGQIHLLATDVIMPEMNGRQLSARLLKSRPEMKCLFMSGYTANIIANQGVLKEGVSFIQKPFSKNELAIKVREAIES
jgi:PAS domain S-box-containing protein